MQSDPEFQKLQAEHLEELVTQGQELINNVASAVSLLKESMFGDMQLSEQQQREIFDVLADTIDRHFQLLDWSIQTRQNYLDQHQD